MALPDFPSEVVSVVLGAIIGGFLTLAATAIVHWHQRRIRRIRLRRRIGAEVNYLLQPLELLYLLVWNLTHPDDEPSTDRLELFDNNLRKDDIRDLKGSLEEYIDHIEPNLGSPIYDSSAEQLGNLKSDQVMYLLQFYRLIDRITLLLDGPVSDALQSGEDLSEVLMNENIGESVNLALDSRTRVIDVLGIESVSVFHGRMGVFERKSETWALWKKIRYRLGGYW